MRLTHYFILFSLLKNGVVFSAPVDALSPYWNQDPNYYEVLSIPPGATEKDIEDAYRKLSIQNHPDKGGDKAKFQLIARARETLIEARPAYDARGRAPNNQRFVDERTKIILEAESPGIFRVTGTEWRFDQKADIYFLATDLPNQFVVFNPKIGQYSSWNNKTQYSTRIDTPKHLARHVGDKGYLPINKACYEAFLRFR